MSLFTKGVRSKARAEIISIKTPGLFRRSIEVLKRGNYTINDRKALILAQNRARAQLKRRNLSDKERRQFREISRIYIPKVRVKR